MNKYKNGDKVMVMFVHRGYTAPCWVVEVLISPKNMPLYRVRVLKHIEDKFSEYGSGADVEPGYDERDYAVVPEWMIMEG